MPGTNTVAALYKCGNSGPYILINSSCGALHNIAVRCNDPELPEPEFSDEELEKIRERCHRDRDRERRARQEEEGDQEEERGQLDHGRARVLGQLKRNEIVEEYF